MAKRATAEAPRGSLRWILVRALGLEGAFTLNVHLLIDAVVRQTTVLIAQLATSSGTRAPLAHVASQVFLDLAEELHAQGVSRRVSAHMFGLALRGYLRKIQRIRESSTDRGRSLWDAVLAWITEQGRLVSRTEVLERFHRDESELVSAVLNDLCESSLLMRVGAANAPAYRALTLEDVQALDRVASGAGKDELVWAIVFREGPLSRSQLSARVRMDDLDEALARLLDAGRIREVWVEGQARYCSQELFVPLNGPAGWEAAVWDHFQAVVRTICSKLATPAEAASIVAQTVGGSTYSFDVWPGHPLEQEVLSQIARVRKETGELRARVRAHNQMHGRPPQWTEVTFYAGQCLTQQEEFEEK